MAKKKKSKLSTKRSTQEKHRKARYSRDKYQESGEVPELKLTAAQRRKGKRLRELCENDLLAFNVRVFPNTSGLKQLGKVQIDSIAHDQAVILNGGRSCKAEPRGYGKTTRTCNAALWGALYGYLQATVVFSANSEKSKGQILARWKMEIMTNDLLLWMFPEIIWPLRSLENRGQRCKTQTYKGALTHSVWSSDRIVFPTITDVVGSGAVLVALPLSSCRGFTHTNAKNEVIRPDMAMFDDVQTDQDADNPNTIRKLVDLIDHSALMLGGPLQTMSAIMCCTVRKPDDLSEHYLNASSWRRVRYKMLHRPATNEKLWLEEYAKIRRTFDSEDPNGQDHAKLRSLAFYKKNRRQMDKGAEITWKWAFAWKDRKPTEISAIQHAYNVQIDDGESVFLSECQNQPKASEELKSLLTAAEICVKQNGVGRGKLPAITEKLVVHIDVQQNILVWTALAGSTQYECGVVDYGHFPRQRRIYVERRKANPSFDSLYPGEQQESQIYKALGDCVRSLIARTWATADGIEFDIDLILIDSGAWTETVNLFIAQTKLPVRIMAAQGVGVTAKDVPFALRDKKRGETHGHHYIIRRPRTGGQGRQRYVMVDVNYWKSKLQSLLRAGIASESYLALFDDDDKVHEMLADHYRAEFPTEVEAKGRRVTEWSILPNNPENELLDNAVGCLVALAIEGCALPGTRKPKAKKKLSLAGLQRSRRQ